MANHKSAKKRIRQNEKRRAANRAMRTRMRNQLKTARSDIAAGGAKPDAGSVKEAVSQIASLATKGILHKKTASRRISRLMKAANKSNA